MRFFPQVIYRSAKIVAASLLIVIALCSASAAEPAQSSNQRKAKRTFSVAGTIKEVRTKDGSLVIAHDEIPGYMKAMTMPFTVASTNELADLSAGDRITFRFSVTDDDSWIDQVQKIGSVAPTKSDAMTTNTPPKAEKDLLIGDVMPDFTLTNEFGKAVKFSDYKGTAYVFTFFFTRCPVPQYCPRLSKNFQSASAKIAAMNDAPTNWHFFSITFDPEHDTPEAMKAYGKTYNYDPAHWSFLTGPRATIDAITQQFGFRYSPDSGLFGHNFMTVVVDANGVLQTAWPIVGDTSENIVSEVLKGARVPRK